MLFEGSHVLAKGAVY